MPKTLKRTLQVLLVLLAVGLSLGAVGGAVWLGDTIHERTYVNKEIPNYNPRKSIPAEALREDFSIIRGAIENEHGAPYLYTSKGELGAMFDFAYAKLNKPMSEIEFVKLVGPIIHAVHDGHTTLELPDAFAEFVEENARIFPAISFFAEDEMFVWNDGTPAGSLPRGGKIVEIDGEPVQALVRQVADLFVPVDGYAYSAARQVLTAEEDIQERFMTYLPYLKGFPEAYQVTLQTPQGEARVRVASVSVSDLVETILERYPSPDVPGEDEPATRIYWEDGVPVLTVASFSESSFEDYAEALERAFTEFHDRGARNLVIDLRTNTGGSPDRVAMLLKYFTGEDVAVLNSYEARTLQSRYAKYTEWPWSSRFEDWFYARVFMERDEKRGVWAAKAPLLTTEYSLNIALFGPERLPEVTLPPFEGEVLLLLSGETFSAATMFAAFAEAYIEPFTIIGQETRGNPAVFTSAMEWSFILPNTRLELDVPKVKLNMIGSEERERGRGVIPDVEVWPTFEDYVEGRDRVLETALELAQNSN